MSKSFLWAGLTAASLFGCAHHVDEAKLGQIPMDQKEAIFTAQHNITVAEANVRSAEQAKDAAEKFHDIAKRELDAAKLHATAAREARELSQRQRVSGKAHDTDLAVNAATREVAAARAKTDYADKLVELRDHQVKLAQARVDAARVDLDFIQADTLRRNNIDPGVNIGELENRRSDARNGVIDEENKLASLRGQVDHLRTVWRERRSEYNTASRGAPTFPTNEPQPAAPEHFRATPIPQSDRPAEDRLMEPKF